MSSSEPSWRKHQLSPSPFPSPSTEKTGAPWSGTTAQWVAEIANENETLRLRQQQLVTTVEERARQIRMLVQQNTHLTQQLRATLGALHAERKNASELQGTHQELRKTQTELARTQAELQKNLAALQAAIVESKKAPRTVADPAVVAENARLNEKTAHLQKYASQQEKEIAQLRAALRSESERFQHVQIARDAEQDLRLREFRAEKDGQILALRHQLESTIGRLNTEHESRIQKLQQQRDAQLRELSDQIERLSKKLREAQSRPLPSPPPKAPTVTRSTERLANLQASIEHERGLLMAEENLLRKMRATTSSRDDEFVPSEPVL